MAETKEKKTYFVGEKASFVSKGRVYKPGDEIDGGLFTETVLAANIKGGKLLTEAQFKASSEKKETPGGGQKPLDEMSVEELKAYAAEKKISVSGDDKAKILEAIKKAEAKGGN